MVLQLERLARGDSASSRHCAISRAVECDPYLRWPIEVPWHHWIAINESKCHVV
jgi:hypothetical protein